MTSDVRDAYNLTTLGPYSFRCFVDCAFTPKRLESRTLRGCRQLVIVGTGRRKRPTTDTIKLRVPCNSRPKPVTQLLVNELLEKLENRRAKNQAGHSKNHAGGQSGTQERRGKAHGGGVSGSSSTVRSKKTSQKGGNSSIKAWLNSG